MGEVSQGNHIQLNLSWASPPYLLLPFPPAELHRGAPRTPAPLAQVRQVQPAADMHGPSSAKRNAKLTLSSIVYIHTAEWKSGFSSQPD